MRLSPPSRDRRVRRASWLAAVLLLGLAAAAGGRRAARGGPLIAFDRRDHIRAPLVDFTRAADLDGDGDLDFVAYEPESDDLAWWENEDGRGGRFAEHVVSPSAGGPRVVAPGDADADGDVDLFALEPDSNRITLWRNDGSGGLAKDSGFRESTQNASFLDTGDVGGDGAADLFVLEADTRRVQWWPDAAVASGGPERRPIFTVPPGIAAEMLSVADVDGDGRLDVLTADRGTERIGIWRRTDGPGGEPAWEALLPGLGLREQSVIAVRAGDADGDGDADLFALRRMPYLVYLWAQQDDGSFERDGEALARSPGGEAAFPWLSIDLGDVDRDGALDFVTSETDGYLCWYRNPLGGPEVTPSPGSTATATATATEATGTATATATGQPTIAPTAVASATPGPDETPWPVASRLAVPIAQRGAP